MQRFQLRPRALRSDQISSWSRFAASSEVPAACAAATPPTAGAVLDSHPPPDAGAARHDGFELFSARPALQSHDVTDHVRANPRLGGPFIEQKIRLMRPVARQCRRRRLNQLAHLPRATPRLIAIADHSRKDQRQTLSAQKGTRLDQVLIQQANAFSSDRTSPDRPIRLRRIGPSHKEGMTCCEIARHAASALHAVWARFVRTERRRP